MNAVPFSESTCAAASSALIATTGTADAAAGVSVAAGAFNGDGYADLAEDATSTSIDMLLNNAKS